MTLELTYLVYAAALGLLHNVLTGFAATSQFGMKYAAGPRDEQLPLTVKRARLMRAYQNFLATFPVMIAAILVAHIAGVHTRQTEIGAMLYFWARLAFIPLYFFGVPHVRTLVWFASVAGIVMVLQPLF